MKRGYGIGALILFTVLGGSLYAVAKWLFPFLPMYSWGLTFLVMIVLAQIFVIHYARLAHERTNAEKENEIEERMWELLDHLQPNLTIDYEESQGHPFIDTYHRQVRMR